DRLGRIARRHAAKFDPLPILRGRYPLLDAVARALDAEGYALAAPVARLDLDDARAHVGEQHRAEGHGDDLTEIENGDVVEREIHVSSWGLAAADTAPDRPAWSRQDDSSGQGW